MGTINTTNGSEVWLMTHHLYRKRNNKVTDRALMRLRLISPDVYKARPYFSSKDY